MQHLQDAVAALDRNGQMTSKSWQALDDVPMITGILQQVRHMITAENAAHVNVPAVIMAA